MLVSHDRAFLDAVTTRTIEIVLREIHDYKVHYSKYVELCKERREQQLRAYENQQKQIKDTVEFIERFRYKPTKSNQVQSRIKQLEKLERIGGPSGHHTPQHQVSACSPIGQLSGHHGGCGKSYGNHQVFSDVTLTIERGESCL